MEQKPEDGAPLNPAPETVTLSKKDHDDLQLRASQSSQNWERLKTALKEIETLTGKNSEKGKGVGAAFYERFEQVLSQMDYKYIWGVNNETNKGFFEAAGRTYDEQTLEKMRRNNFLYGESGYISVKFLDESFREEIERV